MVTYDRAVLRMFDELCAKVSRAARATGLVRRDAAHERSCWLVVVQLSWYDAMQASYHLGSSA